jgi:FAD/FMN-containing dehydrogenase
MNALCCNYNTKGMAPSVMVAPAARDAAITSLSELLGDRLSTGELVRQQHGRDASYHPCVPPDAVAFAQSTEEVSAIVRICARHKVPIIPFGSGSGLEGNVVALRGGVSIDLSRMNQILRVNRHAGEGNFHVGFNLLPNDPKEMAEAKRLNERLVYRALALDGTCTGEHGIGCGKIEFLLAEHGEAVSVMRAIKRSIDPDNIMNPGKILEV